jgi:UDP-N-acetylmuramate dehydrogenase
MSGQPGVAAPHGPVPGGTPVTRPSPADLERAASALEAACPGRIGRDVPLAPLTTFRIGGPAALLLRAETGADLAALARVLTEVELPLLIVGRGSNLLVGDLGWPGLVLQLGAGYRGIERPGRAAGATELQAGGATPMPALASRSAALALGGISFAVAIPGTVGGGVRMNAGAHGTEVGDRLVEAETVALHPKAAGALGALAGTACAPGEPLWLPASRLGLGYRRSALPAGVVVTSARFALHPASAAEVRAEIDEARRWRRDHQPVNQPNCGSVFANPDGTAAARVVQDLGLKGEGLGGARFSEIHANFIVAGPGARPAEVLALIRLAQRRARDELGIQLRTEVQIVGEFDGAASDGDGDAVQERRDGAGGAVKGTRGP